MYNAPRAATVASVNGGTLWALDRQVKKLKNSYSKKETNFQTYVRIIVRANAKKRRTYEQFLATVHLLKVIIEFSNFSQKEIKKIYKEFRKF